MLPVEGTEAAILLLRIVYVEGPGDTYTLPVAVLHNEDAEDVRVSTPGAIIAPMQMGATSGGVLVDATVLPGFRNALLAMIEREEQVPTRCEGSLAGKPSSSFSLLRGVEALPSRRGSAEQSNTSLLYDGKLILKLFRRLQTGENPDAEIGRFLTEVAHFEHIAPFAGELLYTAPRTGEVTTLGLLQGLVANNGDGWEWTLESIKSGTNTAEYMDAARLLGRRTGEMHRALATPSDDAAFRAEATDAAALNRDAERLEAQIAAAVLAIKNRFSTLPDDLLGAAATLLSRRKDMMAIADALRTAPVATAGERTRIHGDYHLGQVLRTENDFVLLDFEGEPARSLEERRAKQSPLRDVAGMLRSFSYAGAAGFGTAATPQRTAWESTAVSAFLKGYHQAFSEQDDAGANEQLLRAYLLEKALYEIVYEVNNRPDWIAIPLSGILDLLNASGETGKAGA